jgi:hypothetical protein
MRIVRSSLTVVSSRLCGSIATSLSDAACDRTSVLRHHYFGCMRARARAYTCMQRWSSLAGLTGMYAT